MRSWNLLGRRVGLFAALLVLVPILSLVSIGSASANVCTPWPSCFGTSYQVTGTSDNSLTEWTSSPAQGGTAIRSVSNGTTLWVGCQANNGPQEDGKYNIYPSVPSKTWDFAWDPIIARYVWVYDWWMNTPAQNSAYSWYSWPDSAHHCNFTAGAPVAPTGVTATVGGTGHIQIHWTDTNGGNAQYVVSNGNVSSATLAYGATSYNWTGLAPGTYMCFTITAEMNGLASPWTPYACATTPSLSPPGTVTATGVSTNTIHITWNDPSGGDAQFIVDNGNTRSATLAAGTTSYNWGGLAPGAYTCFTISATQSGKQSAWSKYACTTSLRYVNLGDSFSAGEGTYGPYDAGTNVSGVNMCHRSINSYSGQFTTISSRYPTVTNVACSGADTSDVYISAPGSQNSMQIPTAGEAVQTSALNNATTLVTMTIGGNDLNLAGLVTACYSKITISAIDSCFLSTFNSSFITGTVDPEEYALESAYAAVKAAAPQARIVVLTYPQIYPTGPSACGLGVHVPAVVTSVAMATAIRTVTDHLDTAIKNAAAAVGGISVLDEENAFAGHEVCTSGSWVNGINGVPPGSDDESLHPTTAGYYVLASALRSYLGY